MAIVYAGPTGSNTSPYETKAKAATSIATVESFASAGDEIRVDSSWNVLYSADTSIASANGVITSKVIWKSYDFSGDVYETMMDGGGSIDCKTNGAYDLQLIGNDTWVGFHFIVGDNLELLGDDFEATFIDCKFSVDDFCYLGSSSCRSKIRFENVIYEQVSSGYIQYYGGAFTWERGSFIFNGGSLSNPLFHKATSLDYCMIMRLRYVDFSAITDSGDYLFTGGNIAADDIVLERCEVSNTYGGLISTAITNPSRTIKAYSVSSADVIHEIEVLKFEGSIYDETSIYRDALYKTGSNYSIKMVSSAYAREWWNPLRYRLGVVNLAANETITIEIVHDSVGSGAGGDLQDDEIGLMVIQPDGTLAALGKANFTRPATILTTPSDLPNSSETWTGTSGMTSENKQYLQVVLSGGDPGPHAIYLCLYKPSVTVYGCPQMDIT